MSQPARMSEPAELFGSLDDAIDTAIASCGDDPRAAVGTLLLALASHQAEIERLSAAISLGYVRGRLQ